MCGVLPLCMLTECGNPEQHLCVRLSVRHKSEFCQIGCMNRAGFGMGASFHLSYTVLLGNAGTSINKGTSIWNCTPKIYS